MNNKKTILALSLTIFLGFMLRIWCIDKPEGLWNDEYISWFIASQDSFSNFIKEMLRNCHMPVYYLYLKIWMQIFGDADLSLRFSSLLMGVPAIFVMYKVGHAFKDQKLGLYCAMASSVSGFLIYFSQEVRLYSLLFLLSALFLLYWIKVEKEPSKRHFIGLGAFGFLILLTHTIGFVFVFISSLALCVNVIRSKAQVPTKYLYVFSGLFFASIVLISPLLFHIFSSGYESQFWGSFKFEKLYFVLNDYFSAIQINIITTPASVVNIIFKNNSFNIMYFIFGFVPTLAGCLFFIKSIFSEDKRTKYLFATAILTLFVLIIAAYTGKLVLSTKYSIEIYPIVVLLTMASIYETKNSFAKKSAILILIILPLFHIIINQNSAPKLGRPEGNKQVINMLTKANITKNDTVILTYYNENKFRKYYKNNEYKIVAIDKFGYPAFILKDFEKHSFSERFDKEIYKTEFVKNDYTTLKRNLDLSTFRNVQKGDKIALVFLKNVSFFSEQQVQEISSSPDKLESTPLTFLAFSYIKNSLIEICKKEFKPIQIYYSGDWVVVVFEKI